jgi:hypothetical protein
MPIVGAGVRTSGFHQDLDANQEGFAKKPGYVERRRAPLRNHVLPILSPFPGLSTDAAREKGLTPGAGTPGNALTHPVSVLPARGGH